ncbi:DUF6973 domain-containing protein [Robertkochia sediminum]|uniref:DUF6973 domain-containing protein n=1 Tax=Robertkochia sediminum TaxID=2785326 RepID=UPI00193189ED|nr:hypothetical protein [Robertkochia sediminum]MBL7471837.1 hypothetical protein [Robertkochia sediminum]
MKQVLQLLRDLNGRKIKGAARLFTRHPLLFSTAIPATLRCIGVCNRLFGTAHHKNNKTNAFRHALWNMLLMSSASGVVKTIEEAAKWAEDLTCWHEDELSPNPPLPRAMDLHNNRIGRELYSHQFKNQSPDPEQITQALLPLLDQAVKIRATEDLKTLNDHLVYITE